ncbi:MAG: ATP-binding protein [Burkholderiales bacterium]
MLENLIDSNAEPRPRRVLIYGTHGIGKSTFGSCAPKPVFIPTEDGLRDLKVKSFPVAKSYGQFMTNLHSVATGQHEFEAAVIDSADWLETLIWNQVCADGGKNSIEEFGFGKGYGFAAKYWEQVIGLLDQCGERTPAMMAIIIAHSKVQRFEDPQTDPYDRYEPNLHKSASSLLQEWVDEVLFARMRVVTVAKPQGSKTESRGVSAGERLLYTTEQPSHLAKNRLSLPNELPLAFASYWEAVNTAKKTELATTPY